MDFEGQLRKLSQAFMYAATVLLLVAMCYVLNYNHAVIEQVHA